MTDIEVPFGIPVLWGKRGAGKSLAALNSPFQPVHVIDMEDSSGDYFTHQDRLIQLGLFPQKFTRADVPTFEAYNTEYNRITGRKIVGGKVNYEPSNVHYGTIVLDTAGQLATWVSSNIFGAAPEKQVDKMSQIVWGKVRDALRSTLLRLEEHCDLVVLLAHEREYPIGLFSPRLNPSVLELTSLSIRLIRPPNQKIPDAIISYARLPFFPPQIKQFTLSKLLQYVEKPADWDNLQAEEKAPEQAQISESPVRNIEEEGLDLG